MTRNDVNTEFSKFNFSTRKQIWTFFCWLKGLDKLDDSTSQSEGLELDDSPRRSDGQSQLHDSSLSSCGTEPVHDMEDYLKEDSPTSSEYESGPAPKYRHKQYEMYKVPPSPKCSIPISCVYPGGIPYPFPLEEVYIHFLKQPRKKFTRNYAAYQKTIQAIYNIILAYLRKKPSQAERVMIAQSLCNEYPVLQCGQRGYEVLSDTLRKRANNVEAFQRKVLGKERDRRSRQEWVFTETESSVETTSMKKDRIKQVHDIAGNSQLVLQTFPQYRRSEKCIEDLAFIVTEGRMKTGEVIEVAENNWKAFVKILRPGPGIPDLIECMNVLSGIFGDECVSIVARKSDTGQISNMTTQPYIFFCPGISATEKKITIMCDNFPFVTVTSTERKSEAFRALILLLSVYYIMDLSYPLKAKAVLSFVQWVMVGKKDDRVPTGKVKPFTLFERSYL